MFIILSFAALHDVYNVLYVLRANELYIILKKFNFYFMTFAVPFIMSSKI